MNYTYKLISRKYNRSKFLIGLVLVLSLGSCSQKVTNPEIQRLESQQELLDLNVKLNNLNLSLEKELVKVQTLKDKVKNANDDAIASANQVKELTDELAKNPGDSKLVAKISRASRRASKDSEKARALNEDLSDVNDVIKSYQNDIKDVKSNLEDLNSKIKIVPKESN